MIPSVRICCVDVVTQPSREEGKVTSSVHLLKGKRSSAESKPPAKEDETLEDIEDIEPPEWLVEAMKNGGAKLRMEDSFEGIDIPPLDIGKDEPFKF